MRSWGGPQALGTVHYSSGDAVHMWEGAEGAKGHSILCAQFCYKAKTTLKK